MNEKDSKKQSETDWTRLEAITDEEIDTTDMIFLDTNRKIRKLPLIINNQSEQKGLAVEL